MIYQTNQSDLLQEYINSLFAEKSVSSSALPRQWGQKFSHAELYEVYIALMRVIKQVDPYSRESMVREFDKVDCTPQQIQGYIHRFWREITEVMMIEKARTHSPKYVFPDLSVM